MSWSNHVLQALRSMPLGCYYGNSLSIFNTFFMITILSKAIKVNLPIEINQKNIFMHEHNRAFFCFGMQQKMFDQIQILTSQVIKYVLRSRNAGNSGVFQFSEHCGFCVNVF